MTDCKDSMGYLICDRHIMVGVLILCISRLVMIQDECSNSWNATDASGNSFPQLKV